MYMFFMIDFEKFCCNNCKLITNSEMAELVVLFVAIIAATCFWFHQRQKNYPPGPWGIPILGNLLQIGNKPFETFREWKTRYGPVILVYFGSFRTVAISDYKLVKEVLAADLFSGRPDLQPFLDRSGGKRRGILFGDGKEWAELRRFTMTKLKELGFGSHSVMESAIQQEIAFLLDDINQSLDQPVSMSLRFNVTTVNVIWKLAAGERFQNDDANLLRVFKIINTHLSEDNGLAQLGMFIPWLTKKFPVLSGYTSMMGGMKTLLDFIDLPVANHLKTHQDMQPRDLLDTFIDKIKSTTDPNSSFFGENAYKSMATVLLDLFTAGGESTSSTLSWFCLYMTVHLDIQEKLHAEILREVGNSRLPSFSDKASLPYLEATILEIMRITSLVPLGIFHNTISDTKIGGYFIPKDTMIITNLYDCHFDKTYWGDPNKFRPERFLDESGTTILKHEPFIPFSSGKRVCPGENLANQELFLILATLLQNYKISTDPDNPNPSLNPTVSFIQLPKPHKLVFSKRLQ